MSRESHYQIPATYRLELANKLAAGNAEQAKQIVLLTDLYAGRDGVLLKALSVAHTKQQLPEAITFFTSRAIGHSAEHGNDFKRGIPELEAILQQYTKAHSGNK